MERIELRPKRSKLFLLLLFSLCMTAAGVYIVRDSARSQSLEYLLGGILCTPLFSMASAILCWRMINPRARIVLSDKGLFVDGQGGPFPWNTIRAAYVTSIRHARLVSVELENGAELAAQRSAWGRMICSLNRGMGLGHVNLSASALSISTEELCRMILERIAAARQTQAVQATKFGWSVGDRR